MPGFGLSLGITIFWLSFIVLIPLTAVFVEERERRLGRSSARAAARPTRARFLRVTFGAALIAAAINVVFGLLVAWVLVRYEFPRKRLFGALVDLPFALPDRGRRHRADRALCRYRD